MIIDKALKFYYHNNIWLVRCLQSCHSFGGQLIFENVIATTLTNDRRALYTTRVCYRAQPYCDSLVRMPDVNCDRATRYNISLCFCSN